MSATNFTRPCAEIAPPFSRQAVDLFAEWCGLALAAATTFLLLLISHRSGENGLVGNSAPALFRGDVVAHEILHTAGMNHLEPPTAAPGISRWSVGAPRPRRPGPRSTVWWKRVRPSSSSKPT